MFWNHGQPCNTSPLGPCPGLLERLDTQCPAQAPLSRQPGSEEEEKEALHTTSCPCTPVTLGGTAGFLVGSCVRAEGQEGQADSHEKEAKEEGWRRARYGRFPGKGVRGKQQPPWVLAPYKQRH